MTEETLARSIQALGYRLEPSEVTWLAQRVGRGDSVQRSTVAAAHIDWPALLQDHRCESAGSPQHLQVTEADLGNMSAASAAACLQPENACPAGSSSTRQHVCDKCRAMQCCAVQHSQLHPDQLVWQHCQTWL